MKSKNHVILIWLYLGWERGMKKDGAIEKCLLLFSPI